VRDNLEEFEWRIVGNHGFMGKKRDVEKRLAIALDDIEYVLVQKHEDIRDFEQLIKALAISQSPLRIPPVLCQPNVIPA
jgi:chlorite dismutase